MSETTITPPDVLRVEDKPDGARWFRVVDAKASAAMGREFAVTMAIADKHPEISNHWHVMLFAARGAESASVTVSDKELDKLVRIYAQAVAEVWAR